MTLTKDDLKEIRRIAYEEAGHAIADFAKALRDSLLTEREKLEKLRKGEVKR